MNVSTATREERSGEPKPAALRSGRTVVRRLGLTDYEATWRAMQAFTDERTPRTPDEIWLTEHAAVYTLGLAGRREHLLRANGIRVIKSDRGGQVTYHAPGQLVCYLLVDLRRARLGIRDMVCRIEAAVIEWLALLGIASYGKRSAPGVYVQEDGAEAKIASIGLRVRNGCTYHGVAVNVDMDLSPFADIDPCGYPGLRVAHVASFAAVRTVAQAGDEIAPRLESQLFGAHQA